jgi:drug/metabolite transporter (DMT)-like permease
LDAFGGEAIGLFCGFIWALNGIITRTQSHKVSPMLMNAIRCGSAGLCFWIALALTSSTAVYGLLSGREWGLLIGSVLIGVTIGDTLYLWSIREIGISRTMALVGVVPLTTLVFEHVLLGRPFPARFVLGCFLVVGGVVCLSLKSKFEKQEDAIGRLWMGALLSLSAAVLWGLSTVMIKPAIAQLTPIEANSVRMPIVALFLFSVHRFSGARAVDASWKAIAIVAMTGVLGMGLGSYFFLMAIDMIGPAKTAVLASVAPVFGMVMAVSFLKEPVTARVAAGVFLCVGGVWLVL